MDMNMPAVSRNELSGTAQAAGAMATIQSAYVMAFQNPRDFDKCRKRILDRCKSYRFAESARYCRKVGWDWKKREDVYATGFSIQAAKMLHTSWGNIIVERPVLYDDDRIRKIAAIAIDVETNATEKVEGVVKKVVERKKPGKRTVLYERENSEGEMVYGLEAYDHEVDLMSKALWGKLKRDAILGLIPGDVLEEMEEELNKTLNNENSVDPVAHRKRVVDSFEELGIQASKLTAVMGGKPSTEWGMPDFNRLRQIYTAIKSGEANIDEFLPVDVRAEPLRATINLDDIKPGDPTTHTEPQEVQPLPTNEPEFPEPSQYEISSKDVWDIFCKEWTKRGVPKTAFPKLAKVSREVFGVGANESIPDARALEFDDWLRDVDDGGVNWLDRNGFVKEREPGCDDE